ncbi:hypothetical protein AVEN_9262-1 [Araneus ventricosus]|uniref:Uncharacterized protein n=1 Tax=Araneus ventricosus TaxID=182803 RepID=A0A4Y2QLT3_ARAVE|nr:hypothetical protein AVEN_9262-1 [Araneus ventricosus]
MCSSCKIDTTRSIRLSIICATTSKQLLGFKLPVPLLDTSVSSMRSTSPEADKLRQALLIIIDEITILTEDGLRCIDCLLRDLMNNDIRRQSYNNRRRLQTDTSSCSKRYTCSCHRKLIIIKPALDQVHSPVTHNKYSLRWTNRAQHVAIEHRIRHSS